MSEHQYVDNSVGFGGYVVNPNVLIPAVPCTLPCCFPAFLPCEPILPPPKPRTHYDEMVDSFVQSNLKALEKTTMKYPKENHKTSDKQPTLKKITTLKKIEQEKCVVKKTVNIPVLTKEEAPINNNLSKEANTEKTKPFKSWASNYLQNISEKQQRTIKINLKPKKSTQQEEATTCTSSTVKNIENHNMDKCNKTNMIETFAPVRPKLNFVIPKRNKPKCQPIDNEDENIFISEITMKNTELPIKNTQLPTVSKISHSKLNKKHLIQVPPRKDIDTVIKEKLKYELTTNSKTNPMRSSTTKTNICCITQKEIKKPTHNTKEKTKTEVTTDSKSNAIPSSTTKTQSFCITDKKIIKSTHNTKQKTKTEVTTDSKSKPIQSSTTKTKKYCTTGKEIKKSTYNTKEQYKNKSRTKSVVVIKKKESPSRKLSKEKLTLKNCELKDLKNKTEDTYVENTVKKILKDKIHKAKNIFTKDKRSKQDKYDDANNNLLNTKNKINKGDFCNTISSAFTDNENVVDLRQKLIKKRFCRKVEQLKTTKKTYKQCTVRDIHNNAHNIKDENIKEAVTASTNNTNIISQKPNVKEITFVINIIHERRTNEAPKQKDANETSINTEINDELNFLDDFNVDELVNCLNGCEEKIDNFIVNESPNTKKCSFDVDDNVEKNMELLFTESRSNNLKQTVPCNIIKEICKEQNKSASKEGGEIVVKPSTVLVSNEIMLKNKKDPEFQPKEFTNVCETKVKHVDTNNENNNFIESQPLQDQLNKTTKQSTNLGFVDNKVTNHLNGTLLTVGKVIVAMQDQNSCEKPTSNVVKIIRPDQKKGNPILKDATSVEKLTTSEHIKIQTELTKIPTENKTLKESVLKDATSVEKLTASELIKTQTDFTKLPTENSSKTVVESGEALKESVFMDATSVEKLTASELIKTQTDFTKLPTENSSKTVVESGEALKESVFMDATSVEKLTASEPIKIQTEFTKLPTENRSKTLVESGEALKESVLKDAISVEKLTASEHRKIQTESTKLLTENVSKEDVESNKTLNESVLKDATSIEKLIAADNTRIDTEFTKLPSKICSETVVGDKSLKESIGISEQNSEIKEIPKVGINGTKQQNETVKKCNLDANINVKRDIIETRKRKIDIQRPGDQSKNINIKSDVNINALSDGEQIFAKSIQDRISYKFGKNFTIESVIHRGKFSIVFNCKNSANNVHYAAKVSKNYCHPQDSMKQERMIKLLQEDIPKENLNCVHLIKSFGVNGRLLLLMEFYPYNLQQFLEEKNKSFHIKSIQILTRQLIGAVLMLRNHNIVHSDIKPSHILLNFAGNQLKLCGFDAAYYIAPQNLLPNIGTVNYRAPEVIIGYSAGFSIDVWSTAVVMYEMATGSQLFPGCFNNNILYQQMCTFGNIPINMLLYSAHTGPHFRGSVFMRKVGHMGKKIVPIDKFYKSERLRQNLLCVYVKDWGNAVAPAQRLIEKTKLRALLRLLEQMLEFDPKHRLPIEFVYASPFIYEPF